MKRYVTLSSYLLIAVSLFSAAIFSSCTSKTHSESGADTFSVAMTDEMCKVDGRLDEKFWKDAVPLDGFRIDADPLHLPECSTVVYLSYGEDALYAAFVCEEAGMSEIIKEPSADMSDYCELLTFSRPETPYYSPYLQRLDYKNANNAVRTQRSFKVSASAKTGDANIYKTGAHSPYITDNDWTEVWDSASFVSNNGYVAELSIPWETIGGMPQAGHDFKLHFVRRRAVDGEEFAVFSHIDSENLHVVSYDPADFNQEHPQIFSPLEFHGDHAVLKRYIETEAPWHIDRTDTVFESVLTDKADPYRAAHFYLGISGFLLPESIRSRYDGETLAREEMNFITELGRAGMTSPFLPGYMNKIGASGVDSLYKEYSMPFSFHGYGNNKKALAAGAAIKRPGGSVAFFDTAYARVKRGIMTDWLKRYGREPWLFDIRGQDEPFNQVASILQPATYDLVNDELMRQFGVGLGVPEGVRNVAYQDQIVHENSRSLPDHETALSRIAMFRWMNQRYYDIAQPEYELAKRYAPNALYQAYNRNAVADMDFLDQSMIHGITDYVSADPYPSFCSYVYGTERSRYHVGFTSKFVTDLACGKPTQMIIQGCDMIQRYSTPANVSEWASQAAKTGASMIDWWGNPRLDHPDLYREMLRISRLWVDLPRLNIPERAELAVIFSDDSRIAAGDEALHAHYSLHVILGEKLGAWYDLVSENHLRKGLHSIEGKKLLIAPHLSYLSREFGEQLIVEVNKGATLVLLDPDSFTHDIETGPLADMRLDFLGLGKCPPTLASQMLPGDSAKERFKGVGALPLRPIPLSGKHFNAQALTVPDDAGVLFRYEDGEAAAFSRKVGKGEIIVFGAMPFHDSELVDADSGWNSFFKALIDEKGIERDMPLWNFSFPETGGEVETFDLLIPELN